METMPITVQLPTPEAKFIEDYARRHRLTIAELFDSYIKLLQQAEDRSAQTVLETKNVSSVDVTGLEGEGRPDPVDDFLDKWAGILEGEDPDMLKWQYLQEKYL